MTHLTHLTRQQFLLGALGSLAATTTLAGCSEPGAAASAAAPSTGGPTPPRAVTIALDWLAQPSNAGPFLAKEKGYYSNAGLEVTIQPGGTQATSVQVVAGGGAQFGLEYGGPLLQARAKGIEVVSLAPTLQKSPAVYVFHRGQDITSLADLDGRTVFTQTASPEWEYTVEKYQLHSVSAVQFQGSYAAFAADERSVAQGYATSTPYALAAQGIPVDSIARAGAEDYGSSLFTTQDLIDSDPDLVRAFVAATLRGWQFLRDDPQGAAGILTASIEDRTAEQIAEDAAHQVDYIWTGDALTHQFGWQTQERWDAIADFQVEQGSVDSRDVVEGAWTTDFLPAP